MSLSGLPFDDIRALMETLPEPDERAVQIVRERNEAVLGSRRSGQINSLQEWLARWSGVSPKLERPLVAVFAGTHGATPQAERDRVLARVTRMAAGGAALNQICATQDLGLKVFDLALQYPVGDIRMGDALDEKSAAGTFAFGMEAIAGGIDLLVLADCGARHAPSASAIFAALYGSQDGWSDDPQIGDPVALALSHHSPLPTDPLELLRRLGGRESWAVAGAIVAARMQHVPVVLDGPGPLSVAAVLKALSSSAIDHCMAGQGGEGTLECRMIAVLGLPSVLGFPVELEDGEGAALAAGILKMAAAIHAGMVPPDET